MTGPVTRRAEQFLAASEGSGRPEVWIFRAPAEELLAAASDLDQRLGEGESLPLAGLTLAVKDNIDVAGVETTAACPAYAFRAPAHAPAVEALLDAGALFVGKTNLDQFATGLVGTRSPYGEVRNAHSPTHIAGGSSSGSGVAVALGLADIALGTDTAGSGRVPAALNGIVGIKPTRGLVSSRGVVPACRSFDCVSVFAPDVSAGQDALVLMSGFDSTDSRSRAVPPSSPLALRTGALVAHAHGADLDGLDPRRRALYEQALTDLERFGCHLVAIDLKPFFAAGDLLYGGAFVAERYAAVGAWVDDHRQEVEPVVGAIISAAGRIGAPALAADVERLAALRQETAAALAGAASLVLPTVAFHPTLAEVATDPVGVNSRLGRFTTFTNLLDYCCVSVPVGAVDGLPFGVSCHGPAWTDAVQADVARLIEGHPGSRSVGFPASRLAVFGAHMSGQPLNHQLSDRGARLVGPTSTAPLYRLYALATDPPKPGLIRVVADGTSIECELWELPPVALAELVAELPSPMTVGPVTLADGRCVTGFLCEPAAVTGAEDITRFTGWDRYLRSVCSCR